MKLHEYQAKEIFANFGIPVLPGKVAFSADEVERISQEIGYPVVVKAQVHVGGRGKAGGIQIARNAVELRENALKILSMQIKGIPVKKVFVTQAVEIRDEYYLGITVDRQARKLVLMLCASGGVDIEEVAAVSPEKIAKVHIDPLVGLHDFQITKVIYGSQVDLSKAKEIREIIRNLYRCYMEVDASLAEINPLAVTIDGQVIALDAKLLIDDNALFRHSDLEQMREVGADLDELEEEAQDLGLAYVHMPADKRGPIGVMGNGAGLVMNTMDEVARAGGKPNNFLDIGGTATAEVVEKALLHILKDDMVKGVFINVFGGIVRCDVVAQGLIKAYERLERKVPIVLRITGTNEDIARQMLEETPLQYASTTTEGAVKIVELVGKG